MNDVIVFLQATSATGAWVSGLIFLRFWRDGHDPLFGFFAAAFGLLGLSWALLAMISPTEDTRPYVYGIRLVAFALIIGGMIAKNRQSSP